MDRASIHAAAQREFVRLYEARSDENYLALGRQRMFSTSSAPRLLLGVASSTVGVLSLLDATRNTQNAETMIQLGQFLAWPYLSKSSALLRRMRCRFAAVCHGVVFEVELVAVMHVVLAGRHG